MLACEKARDKPAGAFVRGRDEAIENTVLSGHSAAGVLSAGRALTSVDEPPMLLVGQMLLVRHRTFTSFGQLAKGGKGRSIRLLKLSLDSA